MGFTILLSGTLVYNEVRVDGAGRDAPQFTCFTGTEVQILTLRAASQIVPLPACCGGRQDWPEAVLNEPHKRDEEEALLGTQNSQNS